MSKSQDVLFPVPEPTPKPMPKKSKNRLYADNITLPEDAKATDPWAMNEMQYLACPDCGQVYKYERPIGKPFLPRHASFIVGIMTSHNKGHREGTLTTRPIARDELASTCLMARRRKSWNALVMKGE